MRRCWSSSGLEFVECSMTTRFRSKRLGPEKVRVMLGGREEEDVEGGHVGGKPGGITPHTKLKAEGYVWTKEEGGGHTPFFSGYRPQFYFRTTDVTGDMKLPTGVEMVMPGD